MVVVILAAGYGTRLYPLTLEIPKALLPIQGKPILGYLLDKADSLKLSVEKVVLVSNHRYAQAFRTWMASREEGGAWKGKARAEGKVAWELLDDGSTSEENRLGSVGDLAFAIDSCGLKDKELLVLGSDNLFKDPLEGFVAFARARPEAVTLGAYELPDQLQASRYGVLTVEGQDQPGWEGQGQPGWEGQDQPGWEGQGQPGQQGGEGRLGWQGGRVLSFQEKPAKASSSLISTAVYFFPSGKGPWVLEYLHSGRGTDTLGSFIAWLLPRCPVMAYRFEGPWFDIGDIESYHQAQGAFSP